MLHINLLSSPRRRRPFSPFPSSTLALVSLVLIAAGIPSGLPAQNPVARTTPPAVSLEGVGEGEATPPPLPPAAPAGEPATGDEVAPVLTGNGPDISPAVATPTPGGGDTGAPVVTGPVRPPQLVMHAPLDENRVVYIPTSVIRTTTLMFPQIVEDCHGDVTPDPAKQKGNFLGIAGPGGQHVNYFSIKPLVDGAEGNFTIICNGRPYAFVAFPAPQKQDAALTVILDPVDGATSPAPGAAVNLRVAPPGAIAGVNPALFPDANGAYPATKISRDTNPPKPAYAAPGAARIIGSMDAIKLLAGLPDARQAQQVAAAMPGVVFVPRNASDVTDHGDYRIQLDGVLRSDKIDTLSFAVTILNTSHKRLVFDPESFVVRAGDPTTGPLYQAVVADLQPDFAPGEMKRAFFVVSGNATGGYNRLDPSNPFTVNLDVLAGSPPAVARHERTVRRRVVSQPDPKSVVARRR